MNQNDEQEEAVKRLEALLLEGLASGEPTVLTKEDWCEIRAQVKIRLKKSKRTG